MPYVVESRNSGETSWSFKKLFNYAIEGIVAFTTSPLRIPVFIGMLLELIFLILLIIFLILGINSFDIIILILLLLFGLLFISIGVIGEYLSKTYIQVKNRPIYIIKNIKEN